MSSKYETVLFDVSDDHVATITINRPKSMNTFNQLMLNEFEDIWHIIREDDHIKTVVCRANMESRAFSAGADRKQGIYFDPNIWSRRDPSDTMSPKQMNVWKPVITACHGLVVAGSFYCVNEADIVICSEETEFLEPHVTSGRVAALEPICLSRRIPLGDVLRMALMGNHERIGAETALRISLVSEIVPRDQLWERAHEIAALIATHPSDALQGTVKAIWEGLDVSRQDAIDGGLTYTASGNKRGMAEADQTIMKAPKYAVR